MKLPANEQEISQSDAVATAGEPSEGAVLFENQSASLALAACFFAMFCVVGIAVWGLPFFYDFMVREFGWTRAQVTSGNALSKLLIGPLFGFLAGWFVDRFGPRRLMIAGVLVAGIALVGLGSIFTLPWFYFFYMLNALGYVCGGPLPAQVVVSRWFVRSRGKAMGLAYLGIGFGGAAAPWIAAFLCRHYGWQPALEILGALVILISFPLVFLMKEPPAREPDQKGENSDLTGAFRSFALWLIIIGSMCSIAAVSGAQQNLKLLLSLDRHFGQNTSAQVLSLVLAFSIVGRVLMGWMADRFQKKYVMFFIYLMVAVAIPFLFLGQTFGMIAAAAAIFGIALGGDYMILPLITAEIFGIKILGRLMGVILTAGGVAEALSPWWIGHLRDASGNYQTACIILVGMALLGAGAVLMLPAQRRSE
ncbi:MAG TPA: MFS transporter [Candidatus Sulfotelmatobacter sp.]|jgi:MFS family permease|nr:MFS transporter [Candidatus Sulfotelmatobacter sp.]